jgi:zinc transport system permease protein
MITIMTMIIAMKGKWMSSFLINALLAGIGMSLVLGPIGCFVVWRRIAFIGDTLSHASIAGVAIALMVDVLPFWGVFTISLIVGVLLAFLREQRWLPIDTWLAILAHSLLAVGLVIFALAGGGVTDLQSYLFGDILTVSNSDVRLLYAGLAVIGGVFILVWKPLVAITINADLAAIEGIKVRTYEIIFMVLVALIVALGVRVVGALLLTAMMIIPAAIAGTFARTPTEMVFGSVALGVLSVILGVFGSIEIDVPTAPFIVLSALVLFLLSQGYQLYKRL